MSFRKWRKSSYQSRPDEVMRIGYIRNKDRGLSRLGEKYIEALKQYQKD